MVLYRWDIRGDSFERIFGEIVEEKNIKNREVLDYMSKLIGTVREKLPQIDAVISEHLEDWNFDRLGYIERNILRLGTAELIFMKPPDPGRAFNDYVDIVKKYADKKAMKFVNGVLSQIYKKRKPTSSFRR